MSLSVAGQQVHLDASFEDNSADSVEIYVYPYYSYYWQQSNASHYTIPVINKKFNFESNLYSGHSYISIYLKNKDKYTVWFHLFLTAPGDSIYITATKDSLIFSGRGSEKFICQYKIQKIPGVSFTAKELTHFANTSTDYKYNMTVKKRSDSITKLKLNILDHFKPDLSPTIFKLLRINMLTENWFSLYNSISLDFDYDLSENSQSRSDKIRYFHELEKYHFPENTEAILLAESSSATDFLLRKTALQLRFINYLKKKPNDEKFNPLVFARTASMQFGGLLKERLYAQCFDFYYRPETVQDETKLETALKETKNAYFHNHLSELKRAMNPGGKAYNFTLFTMDDQKITLDDFKGKVVVLDFWFRGCGPCVVLEQRMKNIRDIFQNDTSVAFVSVNLDTNKDQFIKGVASGKYTGKNEVNLYTGGSAFDHPLVKNYQIIGCPELIIIDKRQQTFMSKPPRPVDDSTDRYFIDLILKAERSPL